jgi:hypothetical protein
MPKQFYIIDNFNGGLKNHPTPSAIEQYSQSDSDNMTTQYYGKIKTLGTKTIDSSFGTSRKQHQDGYGLYSFSADQDMPTSGTITEGRNKFLALFDKNTNYVSIWGDHDTAGTTETWENFSYHSSDYIDYYYVNGGLRSFDLDFTANPRVLQYIKRTHFPVSIIDGTSSGANDDYDGWFEYAQHVLTPTTGIVGNQSTVLMTNTTTGVGDTQTVAAGIMHKFPIDGLSYILATQDDNDASDDYYPARVISTIGATGDVTTGALGAGDTWYGEAAGASGLDVAIFPPTGSGINMTAYNGGTGTWENGSVWEIGYTFVYHDDQESLIYRPQYSSTGANWTITFGSNEALRLNFYLTSPYDERIKGARVYVREQGTPTWYIVSDIDFERGVRSDPYSSEFTNYFRRAMSDEGGSITGNNYFWLDSSFDVADPPTISYDALNGYSPDEVSIYAKYKTAVVGNGRTWIGNVKVTINDDDDKQIFGDRVMFTPPFKYDTFPASYVLDIVPQDGDEIIKLAFYADRLLVFKKERLYIVNVAQPHYNDWFVEDVHNRMGVANQHAVFTFQDGVVWINKFGMFVYNGQNQPINLVSDSIDNAIIKRIDTNSWTVGDNSIIGVTPEGDKIISIADPSSTDTDVWVYNIKTNSFDFSSDAYYTNGAAGLSNFVVHDDELIIYMDHGALGDSSGIYKWTDTPTAATQYFTTKDIDFNLPSVNKRVYAIYLRYKSSVAQQMNNTLSYILDGEDASGFINTYIPSTLISSSSDWDIAAINFSTILDAQSIQLKISATGTFEVDQIMIEYRPIYKRIS